MLHKADSRGKAEHGWLSSRHTFSFADYHNPDRMNFGLLRVLNDDVIQGETGFSTHRHDNMEIISIPISGSLEHKDSMGNIAIIHAGEVQVMSAGSGVSHSEYNQSKTNPANFLQIWIYPKEKNISPRYGQKKYILTPNNFELIVSPDQDSDRTIWINQDAYLSLLELEFEHIATYKLYNEHHGVYFFVIDGEVEVQGEELLMSRDAIGITQLSEVALKANVNSKVLAIEVPLN
ncbi:MAG: pirin family protein [Candidatus Caenarcaniphilales bacterium]|nr:pirin family protein [Candidatus Caenarcaniphilales bacterium]